MISFSEKATKKIRPFLINNSSLLSLLVLLKTCCLVCGGPFFLGGDANTFLWLHMQMHSILKKLKVQSGQKHKHRNVEIQWPVGNSYLLLSSLKLFLYLNTWKKESNISSYFREDYPCRPVTKCRCKSSLCT